MNRTPSSICRSLRSLALAAIPLSGCGGSEVGISLIEPVVVDPGDTVVITGTGFAWDYNAFLDTPTGTFAVTFGDDEAESVTWIDGSRIEATVPGAAAAGTVDVTVETPRGVATREDGLTIRP